MKKRLLTAAFFVGAWSAYSQVGIGTLTPNPSAQLDVVSKEQNKGVLIPRIPLKSTTDTSTVTGASTNGYENSLLVFNTNTQNDITPGYYYWYVNKWMRIVNEDEIIALDKNTKNVSLAVVNNELVLTDTDGNTVTIPLSQINIPTVLVKNPDGTYTYTNEAGTTVTIDMTDNVINNIENILGDTNVLNELIEVLGDTYVGGNIYYDGNKFTYVDASGVEHNINFEQMVQDNETVTNLVYDAATGIAAYTNEKGTVQTINLSDVVKNFETLTSVAVDNTAGTLTYIDEKGNTNVLNLADVIKAQETVTTIVKNSNGTYTYTNEAGTTVTIDMTDNVINNIENILGDTNVLNELIEVLGDTYVGGNVYYDGNKFTYVDASGVEHNINFEQMVQDNETVTNLVYDAATGIAAYTNEKGTVQTINLSDVVKNFETLTSVAVDNTAGTLTYIDEKGNTNVLNLADVIKAQETVTNLTYEAATGIATYTNEEGTLQTINLSDVVKNFETLTSVSVDNTAGTLTYIDEKGNTNALNLADVIKAQETVTTIVKNSNGTYTYTNEAGTTVTLDITDNVINNIENILGDTNVLNELIEVLGDTYVGGNVYYDGNKFTYVDASGVEHNINFEKMVQDNETVTNLVYDAATGIAAYTNEKGTVQTINLSDVVKNFETLTSVAVDNTAGTLTYIDEKGNTNVLNLADVIKAQETVTNLTYEAATGIATYTNEEGTLQTINLSDVVKNFETLTSVAVDNTTGTLTYVDEKGNTNVLNIRTLVGKGDLTVSEGIEFYGSTNGTEKLLANANIRVANDGITTSKIADGAVTASKMNAESSPADTVPTATGTDGKVEYKAVPRFFYMPAVIFDTSATGTGLTRDLYKDYENQFTGGVAGAGSSTYNIAHGATGGSMPYSGGLVSNPGADADIVTYARTQMNYYITYYDTNVFENVSIDDNGVLTYSIKGNATETSYMNIVFVIK